LGESIIAHIYAPYKGEIFADNQANEGSLLLQLSYGEIDFLFTGDLGTNILEQLVAANGENLESEVLKAPHHGSKNSYCESFYQVVQPDYVVFCVGEKNSYGHPAAIVVEYLQSMGALIFRTDLNGTVTFFTDGERLDVHTYK
jgi:competence protein ComEC